MDNSEQNLIAGFILGFIFAIGISFVGAGLMVAYSPSDTVLDEDTNVSMDEEGIAEATPNIITDNGDEQTAEDSIEEQMDNVVTIYVDQNGSFEKMGSGFVYSGNHIVTNEHVTQDGDEFYIQYRHGEWSNATLVGSDEYTDVAVLYADDRPKYADEARIQVDLPEPGEEVIAIGSPQGLDSTLTTGVVSGVERTNSVTGGYSIPDMIQTDAALNPGNSGGPLISTETNATIGMNRARRGEDIGFAISSRMMVMVANSLIENLDYTHARIGVSTIEITPDTDGYHTIDPTHGLVVVDVADDSPAESIIQPKEGDDVLSGDIITRIDNQSVRSNEDLSSYVMQNKNPSDQIQIEVYRDGEYTTVDVTLGER